MKVQIGKNTYRVQFIKDVEQRQRGTTITTICKIFIQAGTKTIEDATGFKTVIVPVWTQVCEGKSRQNPRDKYDHMIGKRKALKNAMEERNLCLPLVPFDRVERCCFATALQTEFAS